MTTFIETISATITEGSNQRAIGHSDSSRGLSYLPLIYSLPTLPSLQPSSLHQGSCSFGGGNTLLLQKRAICQIQILTKGFYSNMFIVPKKVGGQRPETSKQTCEIRTFQDGGPTHSQNSPKERRLDGKGGPQRCLLYGSSSPLNPATFSSS